MNETQDVATARALHEGVALRVRVQPSHDAEQLVALGAVHVVRALRRAGHMRSLDGERGDEARQRVNTTAATVFGTTVSLAPDGPAAGEETVRTLLAGGEWVEERQFRLAPDGSNLHVLVSADEPELLRAALTMVAVDGAGVVNAAAHEPQARTLRMRLGQMCAVLDRAACMDVLCSGPAGTDAMVWWTFHAATRGTNLSSPQPAWWEAHMPMARTLCTRMHVDTLRVLAQRGGLRFTPVLGSDRGRKLISKLGKLWVAPQDAAAVEERVAAMVGVLSGVGGMRQYLVDAVEGMHVPNMAVWRALRAQLMPGRSMTMFRVQAAAGADLAMLQAMEAEGVVDFGRAETCTENCLACRGPGNIDASWGACVTQWLVVVPARQLLTACLGWACVCGQVCLTHSRGAIQHHAQEFDEKLRFDPNGAYDRHKAKLKWLETRRAQGPLQAPQATPMGSA